MMDKYFVFFDDNLINIFFVFISSIIITLIILYLSKKIFKFNMPPYIFLLFIIIRLVIGEKIRSNDNDKFINLPIHSVIIEQVEFNSHRFRSILRNGIVFYTSDQVSTGDSIVKKANSNTYQKYEKDYNGNYDFVKEYNY